jgi:hypothetical protein
MPVVSAANQDGDGWKISRVRLAKGREWNAIHLLALVQHSDPEPTNVYKNRPQPQQPNNQTTKQPNNQTTNLYDTKRDSDGVE